jgi:tRNA U34 2-thiouridine synthase MnmA/TrmU
MRSTPVRTSRWLATGMYYDLIHSSLLTPRTGHYAQVGWSDDNPPRPKLLRAKDRTKDQTYYLSNVSEGALQKVY